MFVIPASLSRSATTTARAAMALNHFRSFVHRGDSFIERYFLRCRAVSTHFMTFSTNILPQFTPTICHGSAARPSCCGCERKSIAIARFSSAGTGASNKSTVTKPRKSKSQKTKMIPRKAALKLTPKARNVFKKMIDITNSQGIILKYENSSQHALRMAFKFDLIKDLSKDLTPLDEGWAAIFSLLRIHFVFISVQFFVCWLIQHLHHIFFGKSLYRYDRNRVSLEVLEDGITPKPPDESWNDNLPKLYIHHNAFMKVLGGTLDVDIDTGTGSMTPLLFDRNGHAMDPNA